MLNFSRFLRFKKMLSGISVSLRFNIDVIFLKSSQRESSLMSSGMRKSFILMLQSLNSSQPEVLQQ